MDITQMNINSGLLFGSQPCLIFQALFCVHIIIRGFSVESVYYVSEKKKKGRLQGGREWTDWSNTVKGWERHDGTPAALWAADAIYNFTYTDWRERPSGVRSLKALWSCLCHWRPHWSLQHSASAMGWLKMNGFPKCNLNHWRFSQSYLMTIIATPVK